MAVEATHFQLYKRTKHVFSEALRVLQFRDVCLAAASALSNPRVHLETLNESPRPDATAYAYILSSCPSIQDTDRFSATGRATSCQTTSCRASARSWTRHSSRAARCTSARAPSSTSSHRSDAVRARTAAGSQVHYPLSILLALADVDLQVPAGAAAPSRSSWRPSYRRSSSVSGGHIRFTKV